MIKLWNFRQIDMEQNVPRPPNRYYIRFAPENAIYAPPSPPLSRVCRHSMWSPCHARRPLARKLILRDELDRTLAWISMKMLQQCHTIDLLCSVSDILSIRSALHAVWVPHERYCGFACIYYCHVPSSFWLWAQIYNGGVCTTKRRKTHFSLFRSPHRFRADGIGRDAADSGPSHSIHNQDDKIWWALCALATLYVLGCVSFLMVIFICGVEAI